MINHHRNDKMVQVINHQVSITADDIDIIVGSLHCLENGKCHISKIFALKTKTC